MLLVDLEAKFPYFGLSEEEEQRLWNDGCHFNPEGYDRFAELIFEVLLPHLLEAKES